MSGTDLEHRTEIQRVNHTTPIWVGAVVLVAIVALVLGGRDGAGDEAGVDAPTTVPATPTSETLTTTSPRRLPPVHGLTPVGGDDALWAFSTATAPSGAGLVADELQEVVVTDGTVVVLADGAVHAAEPGGPFREVVACCVDELHPSNEPGHVWLRDETEVALLELQGGGDVTELVVGDVEVLGPASFGVVTLDDGGVVRWHRPSFEPTVVRLPGDRRAIDSGGERLLAVAPGPALETWSIAGNGLLQSYPLPEGSSTDGLLAPDGTVVLVPVPGGWEVRDAATGQVQGSLPKVAGPVWVGGNRFAGSLDDQLVVSDRGVQPLRWPVLAVAEQSP